MNNTRRTIAGILAAAFVFSAVGCGKDNKDQQAQEAQKAAEVIKNSYSAVEIGEQPPITYIDKIQAIGDTGKYFVSGSGEEGYGFYITDSDFIDYQEITVDSLTDEHADYNATPVVMPDGRIILSAMCIDYAEGTVLPDYEDPDFDWEGFDYEALEAATTYTYYICEIDETGELISQNEVKDMEKYLDGDDEENSRYYINNVNALGNDTLMCSIGGMYGDTYVAAGLDGKVIGKLDLGDNVYLYDGCVNDKDGNLLFTMYDEDENGQVIAKLDAETMTISDDKISIKGIDNYYGGLYLGNEEYPILLGGSSALYGLTADNEAEEIVNWVDSDLNGDTVRNVFPVDNGEFVIYVNDWSTDTRGFYRLTKRDPSELANATIINMVVSYNDTNVMNMIKKFNQENPDYRIRVEEYSKYYEWDEKTEKNVNTPAKQLQSDIAAGKNVDIIFMGDKTLTVSLGKKGILADMYEFMGKDGAPAKDEFVGSVLSGMETDGKLYSMPIDFSVRTLAVKSKFFSEENWTLDDLIEVYNNLPEGCKLYQYSNTKQRVFEALGGTGSQFINYETGVCSFDSPDFIKILEFADRFDNEGEGDEISWETMTEEESQSFYEEQEMAYVKDKALIGDIWLDNAREYKRAREATFGEDITLVGFPSSDGKGAMMSVYDSISIMNSSASKDACWKFVSMFLTEEYQGGDRMYNLPVLKSAFEKRMDESMERPYWTDGDGNKHEYDDTYYMGGKEITIKPLTQEERDYVANYILNAKYADYYYDEDIYSIIDEEVKAFFAGEKSAQDAADMIQDRVSILVSEKS